MQKKHRYSLLFPWCFIANYQEHCWNRLPYVMCWIAVNVCIYFNVTYCIGINMYKTWCVNTITFELVHKENFMLRCTCSYQ